MTNEERKVIELALEALETPRPFDSYPPLWRAYEKTINEAITAIKEALAQPEQEPVAYVQTVIEALYENSDPVSVEAAELLERITTPPQRTWVGLTDEEIKQGESKEELGHGFIQGALWAEATLKEKNT